MDYDAKVRLDRLTDLIFSLNSLLEDVIKDIGSIKRQISEKNMGRTIEKIEFNNTSHIAQTDCSSKNTLESTDNDIYINRSLIGNQDPDSFSQFYNSEENNSLICAEPSTKRPRKS